MIYAIICTTVFFCLFWWGFTLAKQALMKQVLYRLSHTSSPCCSGYLEDVVSRTICLDWPPDSILLISASQVAKITGILLLYFNKKFTL
jgi:hypothetical protein